MYEYVYIGLLIGLFYYFLAGNDTIIVHNKFRISNTQLDQTDPSVTHLKEGQGFAVVWHENNTLYFRIILASFEIAAPKYQVNENTLE